MNSSAAFIRVDGTLYTRITKHNIRLQLTFSFFVPLSFASLCDMYSGKTAQNAVLKLHGNDCSSKPRKHAFAHVHIIKYSLNAHASCFLSVDDGICVTCTGTSTGTHMHDCTQNYEMHKEPVLFAIAAAAAEVATAKCHAKLLPINLWIFCFLVHLFALNFLFVFFSRQK